MAETLRSAHVLAFHDACLGRTGWPSDETVGLAVLQRPDDACWRSVLANHRWNCSLWDEEDLARRTRAADAEIAANKRAIDRFNQARNDAMERIDDALLQGFAGVGRAPDARLSSETAGAMIDRLSILALKVHHMGLQTRRGDVDDAHRRTATDRLAQLRLQRVDLAGCLDRVLDECAAGTGFFKIYRQFKMYNDPSFNPVLVAERRAATGG